MWTAVAEAKAAIVGSIDNSEKYDAYMKGIIKGLELVLDFQPEEFQDEV